MSRAPVRPRVDRLDPEKVAYWYFRLNGFLQIENFVVHSERRGSQRSDADLLAVRFPFRAERLFDEGIWSRWCSYVASGHGGNVELRALVNDPRLDHCRNAFRFALLEYRPSPTPDEVILAREKRFWKCILLTRGEYGLNRN